MRMNINRLCCFLLALVLLCAQGGAALGETVQQPAVPGMKPVTVTQGKMEEEILPPNARALTERPSFVGPEDLILYIHNPELRPGLPQTLQYTVLWGESITEPIRVLDEREAVHATVEALSSGVYQGETVIEEASPRAGSLRAVSGGRESNAVFFYVQAEVRPDMVDTLFDVAAAADALAQRYPYEQRFSDQALAQIEGELRADSRVLDTVREDGRLYYVTADSLMGCLGSTQWEEGYFSEALNEKQRQMIDSVREDWERLNAFDPYHYDFSLLDSPVKPRVFADALETFRRWKLEQADVSDVFLRSDKAMTNANMLLLLPDHTEPTIHSVEQYFPGLLADYQQFLVNNSHFSGKEKTKLTISLGKDALSTLAEGAFTDYGLVLFSGHGNISEVLNSLVVSIYSGKLKDVKQQYSDHMKAYGPAETVNARNALKDRTARVLILHDGEGVYSLEATERFFQQALRDRIFDNTLFFPIICHAMERDVFYKLLLSHGAAVVYGAQESLPAYYSFMIITAILNSLMRPEGEETFGTILSGFDGDQFRMDTSGWETKCDAMSGTLYYWMRMFDDPANELYAASVTEKLQKIYQVLFAIGKGYAKALSHEIFSDGALLDAQLYPDEPVSSPVKYAARSEEVMTYRSAGRSMMRGQVQYGIEALPYKPAANAEVTFYRWLNHGFTEKEKVRTDENGCYEVTLPVGLYGIYVQDGALESTAVCELGAQDETKDLYLPMPVYNNGGDVVGYCGRDFYWKYNDASYAQTGMLTGFYINNKAVNLLVCREPDGQERVLAQAAGNGGLYIAHDSLFFQTDNSLNALALDQHQSMVLDHARAIGVDETSGNLLYLSSRPDSNGEIYQITESLNSNRVLESPGDQQRTVLGLRPDRIYYGLSDSRDAGKETVMEVRVCTLGKNEDKRLTQIKLPAGAFLGQTYADAENLYLSYLTGMGGTGMFFESAGLLRIHLESGIVTVLLDHGQKAMASDLFVVASTEDSRRRLIYFLGTDGVSQASLHDSVSRPYYLRHVRVLDTADMSVSDAPYLTPDGQFVYDSGILARLWGGGDYSLVVSADLLAEHGYEKLQNFEDPYVYSVKRFNIVNRKVFFEIMECQREEELSIGWRDGYRRTVTRMWMVDLDTEQMICVNAFGKSDEPELLLSPTATPEPAPTPTPAAAPTPVATATPKPTALPETVLSFVPVQFLRDQMLPVFAAPSANAWRGAKGKAAVSTNDVVWVAGCDGNWLLVMYETNGGSMRVGYTDISNIRGTLPAFSSIRWVPAMATVARSVTVTDDPVMRKTDIIALPEGTQVIFLARYQDWAYIQVGVKGQDARGFVPLSCIQR